ncbi:MAG TPA: peptidylprolyl isomerase [Thermoanaerobaculia bacterium]|nr:peptidylprolyl isomerase [Thermoanaerobaculia bacterium]
MRTKRSVAAVAAALGLLLSMLACQTSPSATPAPTVVAETAPTAVPSPPAAPPADHIKLQHVLISFAGKVPGKNVTRSREEARTLAAQILDRARKGEDFDELVRTYTDDRAPGIYALSNSGVAPAAGEFSRDRMVPAFGDVGFALAPGQIGMAAYDPVKSPYGWHIIKRLE